MRPSAEDGDEVEGGDVGGGDDLQTLEADFRRALQHQRAEYERVRETQAEIERLMERARALLEKDDAPAS